MVSFRIAPFPAMMFPALVQPSIARMPPDAIVVELLGRLPELNSMRPPAKTEVLVAEPPGPIYTFAPDDTLHSEAMPPEEKIADTPSVKV